jgi:transcription initiation factor TFIIB
LAHTIGREEATSTENRNFDSCDVCGGGLTRDFERGQYVCRKCGFVADLRILSPECERSFSVGTHASDSYLAAMYESGPPSTVAFHDLGISSEIAGGFRDANGQALSGRARYRAIILRRWHSRTRTKNAKDLNIAKALTAINDLANRFGLPAHVREEACTIYRKIAEKRLTIGRSVSSFVAVSLYAAIRRSKLPLMLRDILPILQIGISEFNAYLNIMKREMKIHVPPPDPVAWIPRIACECNFSQQSQVLAAKYVKAMINSGETFGMLPHVVAAIALHRMGASIGDGKKLSQVARAARCSATSILKGLVSESQALRELKRKREEVPLCTQNLGRIHAAT